MKAVRLFSFYAAIILPSCALELVGPTLSEEDSPEEDALPLVQALPPAPYGVVARVGGSDSILLTWESLGGTTADYRISYSIGLTPPADCASGDFQIGEDLINEALRSHEITGLTPNTSYSFTVCAINGATPPNEVATQGMTQATSPTCDYLIAPLEIDTSIFGNANSVDEYDEFQAFHNAASDIDNSDGAGAIVFCFQDGVSILNSNAIADSNIGIGLGATPVWLVARAGDTVIFSNTRTATARHGLTANSFRTLNLVNLTIHGNDIGVYFNGPSITVGILDGLEISASGGAGILLNLTTSPANYGKIRNTNISVAGASGAVGLGLQFGSANSTLSQIENVDITVNNPQGAAIWIDSGNASDHVTLVKRTHLETLQSQTRGIWINGGTGAIVDQILDSTITTHGTNAPGISSEGVFQSLENVTITTNGAGSHAISLHDRGAILAMDEITLRRGTSATGDATAIYSVNADLNYFDSLNIGNVRICSLGTEKWEDHASGIEYGFVSDSGTPPATHSPYNGGVNFRTQTFPFLDAQQLGEQIQGVVYGGTCD